MGPEGERQEILVEGEDFLGLYKEVLSRGSSVRMQVDGVSMSPYLLPGDIVWVEPAGAEELRVGEVALYEREGRPVVHQLAGRTRRDGRWLLMFRAVGMNAIETVLGGEAVLGRVTAFEREGSTQAVTRFPIGWMQRFRSRWRLFLHGRAAEGSWVRRAPKWVARSVRRAGRPAVFALTGLRGMPLIGSVVRRVLPPLGERARVLRIVNRKGRPGEALVVEAYLGRRKIGSASLAQTFRSTLDHEGWWIGIRVAPLYRRRGVASRLLPEVLEWAEARGAGPVYAAIRDDNLASLVLFGRFGFARVDDRELEARVTEYYRQRTGDPWNMLVYVSAAE